MSTSRAIKPKRDDTQATKWESVPERAPSLIREERSTVARVLAMMGLFLLVLGVLAMLAPRWQRVTVIGPGMGFFLGSIGLGLILFHCFAERDLQFRRLYGFLGLLLVSCGVILRLMAFKPENYSYFILGGLPALIVGLTVLIAIIRNETEANFRAICLNLVGGVGAAMIAFGLINGLRDINFLPGEGALQMILGLLFVSAYIGLQDTHPERSHYAGLALGVVGLIGFGFGLVRSLWPESNFLVPNGLILMGISLVYLSIALGICADWPIIVLARRELAAYFYSPIAYLVFFFILVEGWIMFLLFVLKIRVYGDRGVFFEPIVGVYIFDIIPVIVQMFWVPALTMRLLSEEKRTGTLEVLLTAPVNEISIVVGKFLACWIFYMLLWLPWWFFLIALRYMGGEEFDYRPILSFTVAMAAISAGFLSMGLFFSALTTNQIIAAVFTFVGMTAHLAIYLVEHRQELVTEGSAVFKLLQYVNYLDLWMSSLEGTLAPRYLVFHVSAAVFFLFATVKVLQSRKWQ